MNRFWRVAGKVAGSLFLLTGTIALIGFWTLILTSQVTGGWFSGLLLLSVFFGMGPMVLGGWLLYTGIQANQQVIRDQFFQLLQAHQGRVSLLDFSAATGLEPTQARRRLDLWAKACSATFEVSEGGDVYYRFAADLKTLPPLV